MDNSRRTVHPQLRRSIRCWAACVCRSTAANVDRIGSSRVAVAILATASTAIVLFNMAQPELVAASWPTKAMEPLLTSIRTVCESEGACPTALEHRAIVPGIRTLAGRGWTYRSCGGKEFAVFFSQCWSSDCQMFRWTTGKCCSASTPSTVTIDAEWSALFADESEAWIDRLCALDR
jgi:hypothetical protein